MRHWLPVGSVLVSLSVGLVVPAATRAFGAGGATIAVSPAIAAPGARVVVTGSGFAPSAKVTLTFDTPVVKRVKTTAAGTLRAGFVVPLDATPSDHTIGATDAQGDAASTTLTVRASWPLDGFDVGRTGANPLETVLDATRVDGLAPTPISDEAVAAAPIAIGNKAYVGRSDGTLQSYDLTAATIDAPLWSFTAGGPIERAPSYGATATVAPLVIAGSDDGNVYGLDASTGTERWRFAAGGAVRISPLVLGSKVYVASESGQLVALALATGRRVWSFSSGVPIDSSPSASRVALPGGAKATAVIVGTSDGRVLARNASNGSAMWSASLDGAVVSSPVVVPNGKLCGSVIAATVAGTVAALDCATGALLRSFGAGAPIVGSPAVAPCAAGATGACHSILVGATDGMLWRWDESNPTAPTSIHLDGPIAAQASIAAGLAWVRTSAQPGAQAELHAIDLATNTEIAGFPLPNDPVPSGPLSTQSSPVLLNASLIASLVFFPLVADWPQYQRTGQNRVNNLEWRLSAKNVGLLNLQWSAQVSGVVSSPVVAKGSVYFGTDAHALYSFPATCSNSCSPNWIGTLFGAVQSAPAVANGEVYVGDRSGRLYAFPASCSFVCQPTWYADTGGPIVSSPVVQNGVVYVGSEDHDLYAFPTACASPPSPCLPKWVGIGAGAPIDSSPVIANGTVYVGAGSKLLAFDASCLNTCGPLWIGQTGFFVGDPIVYGANVYIPSQDGLFYAFPASCSNPCTPVWRGSAGDFAQASAAAWNNTVYYADDGFLEAFPANCSDPCSASWTTDTYGDLNNAVAIANGLVYVTSYLNFGTAGALEIFPLSCSSNCQPLRRITFNAEVFTSPAIANGIVYVGTDAGFFYAFST